MPTKHAKKKKIIYIMGLGRSGTTLLDIVLGNGKDIHSSGEVNRYPLRQGIRRNTPPESSRLQLWDQLMSQLAVDPRFLNFEHMQKLHWRFEYHLGYIRDRIFGLPKSTDLDEYHAYLNTFYEALFRVSDSQTIVDSSKYPGRAWHLSLALPKEQYEVCYLYVKRDPVSVVHSFQKKDIEQSSKNWFNANLVYFVVNHICQNSCKLLEQKHRISQVTYEALLEDPVHWLRSVEKLLDIDLEPAVMKIEQNIPLEVGNLFDGNRIRHQDQIKIQPLPSPKNEKLLDRLTKMLNRNLYR